MEPGAADRSPEPAALRTLGASAQRTTMEYCSASDLACWTALCCLVSSYPGSTASQFAQPASICITGAIAGHVASSGTVCPPPCPRRRPLILALAIQKDAASASDGPWTACWPSELHGTAHGNWHRACSRRPPRGNWATCRRVPGMMCRVKNSCSRQSQVNRSCCVPLLAWGHVCRCVQAEAPLQHASLDKD